MAQAEVGGTGDRDADEWERVMDGALEYRPTLRERFWRSLGFRWHSNDEPDGVDGMPGWMCARVRFHLSRADRLRLLLTGRLTINLISHTDQPSPDVVKNRLDWQIHAPGDRP